MNKIDKDFYKKLRDAYFCDGGFLDGSYLERSVMESSEKFTVRKSLSEFDNSFRQIVDATILPVFEGVSRSSDVDLIDLMLIDADGKGRSFDYMMRRLSTWSHLYGWSICFWNTPKDAAKNAEELRMKRPFMTVLAPQHVHEYSLDEYERIEYLSYLVGIEDCVSSVGKIEHRYYMVYQDGRWYKTTLAGGKESAKELLGDAVHRPQVLSYQSYPANGCLPVSPFSALMRHSLSLFNSISLLNYQKQTATFGFIHTDDASMKPENLQLNEHSIVKTAQGTVFEPKSMITSIPELLECIAETRRSMYDGYGMGVLNTGGNASGVSRQYADVMRVQGLREKATVTAYFETSLIKFYCDLIGLRGDDLFEIRYPDEFGSTAMGDFIKAAQGVIDTGISPQNAARIRYDLVLRYFPDLAQDEKEKVIQSENNNMDFGSDMGMEKDE